MRIEPAGKAGQHRRIDENQELGAGRLHAKGFGGDVSAPQRAAWPNEVRPPTPVSSTSPIATSADRPILSNSTIQNGGMPGMNGIAAITKANTIMGNRCGIAINPSLPRPRAPPAIAAAGPE